MASRAVFIFIYFIFLWSITHHGWTGSQEVDPLATGCLTAFKHSTQWVTEEKSGDLEVEDCSHFFPSLLACQKTMMFVWKRAKTNSRETKKKMGLRQQSWNSASVFLVFFSPTEMKQSENTGGVKTIAIFYSNKTKTRCVCCLYASFPSVIIILFYFSVTRATKINCPLIFNFFFSLRDAGHQSLLKPDASINQPKNQQSHWR